MDKYNFFHQGGPRPTEGQRLDTKLLYRNSNEVYARFDDWKDIDKLYFIPLYLGKHPNKYVCQFCDNVSLTTIQPTQENYD